ncbi:UNKNOWN [Stylonychia lemnae]|uniref:EF-hand domain-containing protein n=1 Tax=Stylonychia lemnae TaxID=5949 RepID=A0A077ZRH7_STYLE|nr:UNKNOWN [Stylonychia lemnae]|eukprot:CDW72497.1 UNKNOWN [Stylonychia lemnae]
MNASKDQKQLQSHLHDQETAKRMLKVQSLKDFQLPSISKQQSSMIESSKVIGGVSTGGAQNMGYKQNSQRIDNSLAHHQSVLNPLYTSRLDLKLQCNLKHLLNCIVPFDMSHMNISYNNMTQRDNVRVTKQVVKLKKKDEYRGEFLKNLVTAKGGEIIKNLRMNSLGAGTQRSIIDDKLKTDDRLSQILYKKNYADIKIDKNNISSIKPFLFNPKKDAQTGVDYNNDSDHNANDHNNSSSNFHSNPHLNLSKPLKLDLSHNKSMIKDDNVYQSYKSNLEKKGYFMTQPYESSKNKYSNSPSRNPEREGGEYCQHCQHCKAKDVLEPNDYLFIEKYNFGELKQNHNASQSGLISDSNALLKERMAIDKALNELIQNKRSLKEIISEETINQLVETKLYKGITEMHNQDLIKMMTSIDHDDLNVRYVSEITDSNQITNQISHFEYLQLINENFKDTLANYLMQQKESDETFEYQISKQSTLEKLMDRKLILHQRAQSSDYNNGNKILLPDLQLNVHEQLRYKSMAIYIGIQEVIRQLIDAASSSSLTTGSDYGKDRGLFLIRLIKEYFKENERKWYQIIKKIGTFNKVLKQDRELLMCKYNIDVKMEIPKVIDNMSDTIENLVNHKRIIKTIIGKLNQEEDQRLKLNKELKTLRKQIDTLVFDANELLNNQELMDRLKSIKTSEIYDFYAKQAKDEDKKAIDIALMVNSDRFAKAAKELRSQTQISFEHMTKQHDIVKEERNKFKRESKYYEKQYYDAMEKIREKEKEMKNLQNFLKSGNQDAKFWKDYFKDEESIEIEPIKIEIGRLDSAQDKNSANNEVIDKDGKKKQLFPSRQAEERYQMINYEPVSKEQVLEFIVHIYSKKAQEMGMRPQNKDLTELEFEESIYQFFKQRYQGDVKTQQQCLEFLLGLKFYANKDERVETFMSFLPTLDSQANQNNELRLELIHSSSSYGPSIDEHRKYSKDVLDLYVKLMKCTDCSINQILQQSTEQSVVSYAAKYYFERTERNVIFNASVQIKTQLLRNLVYESDVYIDSKRVTSTKDLNIQVRFELYILMEFYKSTEAVDIQHFAQILEKKCKTTNEYGLAQYEEFQKVFFQYLGYWDQLVAFQFFTFDDLISKYFPKSIKNVDGQRLVGFKGMRTFYRQKYELKLDTMKFLNVAMKITIMFYQEAKFFYNRIFNQVDAEGRGLIEFHQFQQLIKKIKPDLPHWKIFAIFQSTSNQDKVDVGKVSFPQFLRSCLNHNLMEGLMNIDFSSIKEQHESQEKEGSGQGSRRSPNIKDIKRNRQLSHSPNFRAKQFSQGIGGGRGNEKIKLIQF